MCTRFYSVDEWSSEARTAIAKHTNSGEERLGVALRKSLRPSLETRMELDRPLTSGHVDNDTIIGASGQLPKILPKKRSET